MHELTLRRPDDWHLHLRDGSMLEAVLPHTSRQFARAIVMPNIVPSAVDTALAREYRNRIENALPEGHDFTPLMTLYLTEDTDAEDVVAGHASGEITAVKLYPAGATTNSHNGVRDVEKVYPVFERMAEAGVPLCLHGEVTDDDVDIFDREAVFIEKVLEPLRQRIPTLRIIMEHLTTKDAVDYVASGPEGIAGTITAHHLILNRSNILDGGIHPHYYCMPIAKGESHRLALRKAATSGNERYFLGTDSAPHLTADKESDSGRAGIFTAPVALSCFAHVFEQENALDKLEGFASLYGPAFYRLPVNEETIRLVRREAPIAVPETINAVGGTVTVFNPMFPLHWDLET